MADATITTHSSSTDAIDKYKIFEQIFEILARAGSKQPEALTPVEKLCRKLNTNPNKMDWEKCLATLGNSDKEILQEAVKEGIIREFEQQLKKTRDEKDGDRVTCEIQRLKKSPTEDWWNRLVVIPYYKALELKTEMKMKMKH